MTAIRMVILTLIFLFTAAGIAYAQFNKCGPGFCPSGVTGRGFSAPVTSIPPPVGKIQMVDGVSFVLQVDAASKICRAAGC